MLCACVYMYECIFYNIPIISALFRACGASPQSRFFSGNKRMTSSNEYFALVCEYRVDDRLCLCKEDFPAKSEIQRVF